MHALAAVADGAQVDGSALVGLAELGYDVLLDGAFEGYEVLLLGAVVADADGVGVDKLDDALALGDNLGARVAGQLGLDAGADDRSLGAHQRHGLAHHVRAHQRAVGVVVLEEGDERGGD